jgi:hypothetical protein
MADLGKTKQKQTQTQQLSPAGGAAQNVGLRFLLNLLGQGPSSWQDFAGAGYRARANPATPLSLGESAAFDPTGVDPGIAGMTHPFNQAGFLTVTGGRPNGAGGQNLWGPDIRNLAITHPELMGAFGNFAGPGGHAWTPNAQPGVNPASLTIMDLLRGGQR